MLSMNDPRIARVIKSLESLYPERKVFALSSLDDHLRETLNSLYQEMGYKNLDSFLNELGYEIIPASAVRDIRSEVLYYPGEEPEPIRTKIENMKASLDEYYPDRIITGNLQKDHKKLASRISGLYQWLGYTDYAEMLEAYGYEYKAVSGRPENDYQTLIDFLLKKYSEGPKPKNMGIIIFDNPEYRAQLKTLQNKSQELFGMSLKDFFTDIGIFEEKSAKVKPVEPTAKKGPMAGTMQDAAAESLKKLYETLDPDIYGSYEEAADKLNGLTVKQNKAGEIYIFRAENCPENLVIPYGIDFITPGAFHSEKSLVSITFPDSIKEIPSRTFVDCTALKEIHFGKELVSIGDRAFAGCTSLESLSLPESIETLGREAFAGCTELKEFINPNSLLSVGDGCFDGCKCSFEAVSDELASNPDDFIWKAGRKDTVIITEYIGKDAIVRIPAFIDSKIVSTIGVGAFQGNLNIREVVVPDSVDTMQKDVFRDCEKLEKVTLSNNLSKIISTCFNGCSALKEINIPDKMLSLSRSIFKDSPISKMHIGKGLRELQADSFVRFESNPYNGEWTYKRTLREITISSENQWLRVADGCVFSADGKVLQAALKAQASFAVPEGVEEIGDKAFRYMSELSDISFPDSLVRIGKEAFEHTRLRSIRIKGNIRHIDDGAFENIATLTSVLFDNGVEEIGESAFAYCPIVSVVLPASLRKLGARSFPCLGNYNDKMKDFRIDENNPWLQADGTALYHLDGDKTILSVLYNRAYREYDFFGVNQALIYEVKPGTTDIADDACKDCVNLSEIILPDSLLSIGKNAFKGTSVGRVELPESLKEIGQGAFDTKPIWNAAFTSLCDVAVAAENKHFYSHNGVLFAKKEDGTCAVVTYFGNKPKCILPENCSEIYGEAFANTQIVDVWIPRSVKIMGENAFAGCRNLRRINIFISGSQEDEGTASVYLPIAEEDQFMFGPSLREQFMDCIRTATDGNIFDFEKYDSLFESILEDADKVRVAASRLKSAINLDALYENTYRGLLLSNPFFSAKVLTLEDDPGLLEIVVPYANFDADDFEKLILFANENGLTNAQVYLMNCKHDTIGHDFSEFEL